MPNNNFIPITRPTLPKFSSVIKYMEDVFQSGMITDYKYVRLFEEKCAKFLGVKYAVALSNGTSALLLTLKCLGIEGEVILPSFTYSSGGHVLLWSGLKPVFADIDNETLNLNPDHVESKITKNTAAIMPTHVFGNPADISKLEKIAKKHNLKIIYDGAHAFGATYKNKPISTFGDATIFSFTPTKVLTAGEGGLVATNNKELAEKLKIAKLNGDSFNRDEEFLGFTARMSEMQGILALECLRNFKKDIAKRLKIVDYYIKTLSKIPGISFQKIAKEAQSVYKDMVILIDEKKTGFSRDEALDAMKENNIQSKVYFYPPLHRKKAYTEYKNKKLPITDLVSLKIMNLPLYSHMPLFEGKRVCKVLENLHLKSKKL